MKKPRPRVTPGPWRRLRPLAIPILALFVLYYFMTQGPGIDEVPAAFDRGHVEAALSALEVVAADLPEDLQRVRWWSADSRAAAIDQLRDRPDEELFESPTEPTIISPRDGVLTAPTEAVLREPTNEPLVLEVVHMQLGLPAATLTVPLGADRVALDVDWLPGSQYMLALRRPRDETYWTVAGFEWLPTDAQESLATRQQTARELADDERGGRLMAALVALDAGCTDLALRELTELENETAYAGVARELRALARDEQGLDLVARELLR